MYFFAILRFHRLFDTGHQFCCRVVDSGIVFRGLCEGAVRIHLNSHALLVPVGPPCIVGCTLLSGSALKVKGAYLQLMHV